MRMDQAPESVPLRQRSRKWWRVLFLLPLVLLGGYLGLWLATEYVSTHDLSPIARFFSSREKSEAVDKLRSEGIHVYYLRSHLRNGWKVVCVDEPSMDDARLARVAHCLRVLGPGILIFGHTSIGDAGVAQLNGITSIRYLDLGWTNITDQSLKSIATLPQLRELYVNNTKVSDAGLVYLHGLGNLELLCVGQSKVTQQGVKDFGQQAPRVHLDNFSR